MTGIEVILLIIGAMIFAASFIFTSRRKILRIRL